MMEEPTRKKHTGLIIIFSLLVLIAIVCIVGYSFFDIRSIVVEGNSRFSDEEIISFSGMEIGNNIFMFNSKDAMLAIEENIYIDVVSIEREYPNTVKITVNERNKDAVIFYSGNYIYIDREGNILEISNSQSSITSIPVASGIDVSAFNLGQKIAFNDTLRFSAITTILKGIYECDIAHRIQNIDFSDINNIVLKEHNGMMIKIGQAQDVEIKIKRSVKILEYLENKNITSGLIDASTKGFASYIPDEVSN